MREQKVGQIFLLVIEALFLVMALLLMIGVPLPLIDMESVVWGEYMWCIIILIYVITKHFKEMPLSIFGLSIFTLLINLGLTRITFSNLDNEQQLPIVSLFSRLLCFGSFVSGLIFIVFLLVIPFVFIPKVSKMIKPYIQRGPNASETGERDFWADIEGAMKFLFFTVITTTIIAIANVAGITGVEMFMHNKSWLEAFKTSTLLTSGNTPLFVIPLLLNMLSIAVFAHNCKEIGLNTINRSST